MEKVIREWRKELDRQNIYLGHKRDGLAIDCLAFADDLALLASSIEVAVMQLNILRHQAAKVGLQVSLEKTKYLTNISESPRKLQLEQGIIEKVNKFKYLGEWIESNLSESIS